ncbi:MAG: ATP-dependent Clp protease ATP-binding subunit [Clostridia bacterium]|nr:ATP-dependent Clp protease ATP-binding subunit [Clostridia bacterium]
MSSESFYEFISPDSFSTENMDKLGTQIAGIISAVDDVQNLGDTEESQGGGVAFLPFIKNIFSEFPFSKNSDNKSSKNGQEKSKKNSKKKYLEMYCDNLTRKARENKLDAIIGRENEISRVIQILSRRTKNNPCLTGEPGVGKTAIAEGLAIKISSGNVPIKLKNKEIYLLDLTALVAGTQFRGQFESRIKGLIDEVKNDGNIILFIDEVHNLVGTGDSEGSMSAANILKPALSRGEIQVIGATTFKEYRKYIEKDAALERRFQQIKISEPSIKQTVSLLMGIKSYYENYHRVKVPNSLLGRIALLSERYITERYLPDKAIDLLDESCACSALGNKYLAEYDAVFNKIKSLKAKEEQVLSENEPNSELLQKIKEEIGNQSLYLESIKNKALDMPVTDEDISKVIELWTGIPATKIKEDEFEKLKNLQNNLSKKIKGQNDAIKTLCSAIMRSRTGISFKNAPPSFIFVGSTGVGKTALVKCLAEEMFDSPDNLIRLDMSEYMEKHAVSKIIGSPPGYVGYDEAGQITEKVRQHPYSIILFDEIEKAHPDIMNILLQILDEGKINDSQGRSVSFENTVIVMTSNAGSNKNMGPLGFGKNTSDLTEEKARKALAEFLRPEFLSRIDEIVVFKQLNKDVLIQIAELKLDEFVFHLKEKGINLIYEADVPKVLVEKIDNVNKNGAREIDNLICKNIIDKLASVIISRGTFNLGQVLLKNDLSFEVY